MSLAREKTRAKCLDCDWDANANDWLAADLVSDEHADETGHETTTVAGGQR
ncbi:MULTISPECIES: hypothetical protein [unclassified Haloferax]|uniref:hypothetical protein n=1 Tax=unclassified Haloferax TaxID=2625095 RepID=UPI002874F3C1|nr:MULTISPECIES: hypothetical protein [unclassified Haloferax]MDS0243952.1 hypothetical protein [Haloferax sp. S2CR25]MDS0447073.1 hypothetical protein [Haloferax sp. S2CR25-2]